MPDLDDPHLGHLDDGRLEQIMRDGLASRAAIVQPTAPIIVAEHPAYGRRPHRTRKLWVASAAAALLVAAGVPLSQHLLAKAPLTPGVTSGRAEVPTPASWRWESYAGVELRVPPTWGWGGTPVNPGAGATGYCEVSGASVTSTGERDVNAAAPVPYVGRPVMQSDACALVTADQLRPDVDAVWFGSPLPVGQKEYADRRLSRTTAVGPVRVTVFATDRATIDEVLASARSVGSADANGCATEPAKAYDESGARPSTAPTALVVCAYTSPSPAGRRTLLFGATRDAAAAEAYRAAVTANGDGRVPTCASVDPGELVVIGVRGNDGTTWDRISLGSCPHIVTGSGGGARVVAGTVRPWSGPEAKAYLVGPYPSAPDSSSTLAELFRGILG